MKLRLERRVVALARGRVASGVAVPQEFVDLRRARVGKLRENASQRASQLGDGLARGRRRRVPDAPQLGVDPASARPQRRVCFAPPSIELREPHDDQRARVQTRDQPAVPRPARAAVQQQLRVALDRQIGSGEAQRPALRGGLARRCGSLGGGPRIARLVALHVCGADHLGVANGQGDRAGPRRLKLLGRRVEPRVLERGDLAHARVEHAHDGGEALGARLQTAGQLALGHPELRSREQPFGVERRQRRGLEVAFAAQLQAQRNGLSDLDDGAIRRDREGEARAHGAREARRRVRGGNLLDDQAARRVSGPPLADVRRPAASEQVAPIAHAFLDVEPRGRDLERALAQGNGDALKRDGDVLLSAPARFSRLPLQMEDTAVGRDLDVGPAGEVGRIEELERVGEVEQRYPQCVLDQVLPQVALQPKPNRHGNALAEVDRGVGNLQRDFEPIARRHRGERELHGAGGGDGATLLQHERAEGKVPRLVDAQPVAEHEAHVLGPAHPTADDHDRGADARLHARRDQPPAPGRRHLHLGHGLLLEALGGDADLDGIARVVGGRRHLEAHGLGTRRGDRQQRRQKRRQRRQPAPHQSFSTVS